VCVCLIEYARARVCVCVVLPSVADERVQQWFMCACVCMLMGVVGGVQSARACARVCVCVCKGL